MFALLFLQTSSAPFIQLHEEKAFLTWMRQSNTFFTGDEYQLRLGIFLANKRYVQQHNSQSSVSFKLAMNKFSAYTPAEYKSLLGYKMSLYDNLKNVVSLPEKKNTKKDGADENPYDPWYDWRNKGAVNEIQDQGQCGSCWAFSALQAAESINAIKTGKLEKYSEQSLLDCNTETSYGCNGGRMDTSYDFIIASQGGQFNLASEYPYAAVQHDTCEFDKHSKVGSLTSYIKIKKYDENELWVQVEVLGPASVAIDAHGMDFMLYKEGIYDNPYCSFEHLDHGVGVVGHGKNVATFYWIVRNSWGTSWGENGYIKMIHQYNICGIATQALIPVA